MGNESTLTTPSRKKIASEIDQVFPSFRYSIAGTIRSQNIATHALGLKRTVCLNSREFQRCSVGLRAPDLTTPTTHVLALNCLSAALSEAAISLVKLKASIAPIVDAYWMIRAPLTRHVPQTGQIAGIRLQTFSSCFEPDGQRWCAQQHII